jgi:hypothetical protein
VKKHEVIELQQAVSLSLEFSEPVATSATQAEIDDAYRQRKAEQEAEKQRARAERIANLQKQADVAWLEHKQAELKAQLVAVIETLAKPETQQSNAEAVRRLNREKKAQIKRRIERLEAELEAKLAFMAYNRSVLAERAKTISEAELIQKFGKVPTPLDVVPLSITK